ncbi:DNA-directed RNA polymerase subunit D [Candidatus Woesearchaeota archaeon]|nr:DNA-directed RNA polymerase subunit D [Candidatus Woesearchaeota archaeon]
MEVRLLEKSKDGLKIKFLVKGVTDYFANTLRRSILEEVPTMAIEDVDFKKNNSILYDEIVSHRLGLLPLKTNLKSYNLPAECKCKGEGCARCQAVITLRTSKVGNVTAADLKSKDTSIVPIYPEMIITKLLKGQNLEFEAKAVLGKGKVHSKWSPGLIFYYNEAKITVNNDDKLLEKFKEKYPPHVFDNNGKIDRNRINTSELIDACEGVSRLVVVERKEDSFVFVLESWGQLPPKVIIQEAISQVQNQLDELAGLMK